VVDTIRRALILAPMASELRPLVKQARARRQKVDGGTVHTARVGETEVVIAQLGVGPVVARRTTEWALRAFRVDHVLVSGIAGGLHPDLPVGAVVVPEVVIDLGSGQRYETSPLGAVERRGIIGTADHLIGDERELDELLAQGLVALEMESSGVAAACEATAVPWTTFRVISDRPDEHLTDDTMLSLLRPDGSARVAAAIGVMARHPSRISGMVHLGRDSSMAASKVARVALAALGG
jgi:nucleoside phosphorylase